MARRRRLRYVPRVPMYNYGKIIPRCLIVVVSAVLVCVIVGIVLRVHEEENPKTKFLRFYSENEFMIDEARCKIPDIRPTSIKDLKLKREKLQPCDNSPLLTTVGTIVNSVVDPHESLVLEFHAERVQHYKVSAQEVNCSYQNVFREPGSDSKTYLSDVLGFISEAKNRSLLNKAHEHIYVVCYSKTKEIYRYVHSIIVQKEKFIQREKTTGIKTKKPYKVLMLGINDMSRINFHRGLPKSYNFLKGKNWFEFKGYTRLASDSSFGNVFPILTGQSANQRYMRCNPKLNTFLDDCDFIWKKFQKAGYITAFAEDQKNHSTFHARHKGFLRQPTDYYFRPFVLEAEKNLQMRNKDGIGFCLGPWQVMDYILVYVLKMNEIHANDPYFGFFYINSLNDKQLSTSPILDARLTEAIVKTLEDLNQPDLILIYFSDKGLRFEESAMGFYEERLPFLSIRLPVQFQEDHPELVSNLRENLNRLTTPYDLHITLKHILNLSVGRTKLLKEAVGCPNCKSLFDKIPMVRSCLDAEIPPHSCPCSLMNLNPLKYVAKSAAEFAVSVLNQKLNSSCSRLKLTEVTAAKQQRTAPWNINYIIRFNVSPSKAQFEVIVSRKFSSLFSLSPKFELIQEIEHVNKDKEPIVCVLLPQYRNKRMEIYEDYEDNDEAHFDLLDDPYESFAEKVERINTNLVDQSNEK